MLCLFLLLILFVSSSLFCCLVSWRDSYWHQGKHFLQFTFWGFYIKIRVCSVLNYVFSLAHPLFSLILASGFRNIRLSLNVICCFWVLYYKWRENRLNYCLKIYMPCVFKSLCSLATVFAYLVLIIC